MLLYDKIAAVVALDHTLESGGLAWGKTKQGDVQHR